MITINGSDGEGGGQVLRTALGLSLVTATPFRITSIRAGRKKPGLLRQHLAAVRAAAAIGDAEVSGDSLSSAELVFRPRGLRGGEHAFSIGSAGSASLVMQTVLPALLRAPTASRIVVDGGTHNPLAPSFEFLAAAFMPLLARMGGAASLRLIRHGFVPAGGGKLELSVSPSTLTAMRLLERGPIIARRACALLSSVPNQVATRELGVVRAELGFAREETRVEAVASDGPGNVLSVELEYENVTELFIGFGERGVQAERVAHRVCDEARAYLATDAPVGTHLADQLVIPLAMAGGGVFRTLALSEHTRTQLALVPRFLDVPMKATPEGTGATNLIMVGRP